MKTRTLFVGLVFFTHVGINPAVWAITPPDSLTATRPSAAAPAAPDFSGGLSLRDALAATLSGSPRLAAFSWEIRTSEAKKLQASLRPNPELSINPENFLGSGDFGRQAQYQNTLQLSQLIELGDKRALRTEAASAVKARTEVEYELTRVEVLAAATTDFIDVVGAQEEVRLARLALSQAQGLVKAVEQRLEASVGSPLEQKRAQVLAARADIAVRQAARTLDGAKQKLVANWGGGGDIGPAAGDLFATHPLPPLAALLERIDGAPERRIAVAKEAVRAAEAMLTRSRRVSDVVVSGAWRQGRGWDDQAVVAGVSFPLQIFDRAQGDIAASDAQSEKAEVETAAIEVRLRAVVYGLYQEIVQAGDAVEGMTKVIVPRTEEAVALARTGFARGLYSQLDILDAQRTLVEIRREHIQAGTRYHSLIAEIEKLLGTPL